MKVLAFDPGESTGWSIGFDGEYEEGGTCDLWDAIHALAAALLGRETADVDEHLLEAFSNVDTVVIEDWSLYPWELQNLAWDKCRTARGIGAIELICRLADVPYVLQPAKIKETAVSGGAEMWYVRPLHENRHQNDATQHLWFYFNGLSLSQTAEERETGEVV